MMYIPAISGLSSYTMMKPTMITSFNGMIFYQHIREIARFVTEHSGKNLGSDSRTVSEFFKLKVTFKVAILKSDLHQYLNLTCCCVVYIPVMLYSKASVE